MRNPPKSYKDLPWQKYVSIINKIPSEKPAQLDALEWNRLVHITTLTILCEVSEGEIEQLGASKVFDLIQSISFMDFPIEPVKIAYKVKDINNLTYDEFITYQRLRADQWNNLSDILQMILVGVTAEQVEAMSIHDVMQVFFCLNKSTQKFLQRLKYLTAIRAIWLIMKQLPSKLKERRKTSLKTVGGGST